MQAEAASPDVRDLRDQARREVRNVLWQYARLKSRLYAASVTELSEKVARTPKGDPKLAYLRSLVILTKKVELDLRATIDGTKRLFSELEEMHDFVHEVYPGD